MNPHRPAELALRSRRVLFEGALRSGCVHVRDGKIAGFAPEAPPGIAVTDVGDRVVLPGFVDTHAHINEPGRTEWEGFKTATRAAAAGGITTVIDMPLNSIPATTTLEALRTKAASAEGHCTIDYGFWGGVVPGNTRELEPMIEAGVFGFKAFMCPSGVSEFPMATEADLKQAMPILAKAGVPLIVHAEIESAQPGTYVDRTYRSYLRSRPQSWEVEAIRLLIGLAKETGCRTHIVHLSAAQALPELKQARAQGVPISAETCPHYLAFDAESIADGATHFKCAPPIREKSNQDRLWQALKEGEIEFVVSDHSPCIPGLKLLESGDFGHAWGGIAGLQFSASAVWTGMKERGFSIADLSRLMSFNTARFLGLGARKGSISPGLDADLVVFDPDASFVLEPSQVLHRHSLTPYAGRRLHGRVEKTFLRGVCVFESGEFGDSGQFSQAPTGERMRRPSTPIGKLS